MLLAAITNTIASNCPRRVKAQTNVLSRTPMIEPERNEPGLLDSSSVRPARMPDSTVLTMTRPGNQLSSKEAIQNQCRMAEVPNLRRL